MSNANLATSALFFFALLTGCNDSDGPFGSNHDSDDPVALGAAGDFAILAKSGISTGAPSMITGDVGLSPATGSAISGFELMMDSTNQYATSSQVSGKIYAADYQPPTPENLKSAVSDMDMAFTDANRRNADTKELGDGDIGGLNLSPGVYTWDGSLFIPDSITLTGELDDVWIFKVDEDLIVSNDAQIIRSTGVLSSNVFWQVGGLVDVGEQARFIGTILAKDTITLRDGATVEGRLLSKAEVVLDKATVMVPPF